METDYKNCQSWSHEWVEFILIPAHASMPMKKDPQ